MKTGLLWQDLDPRLSLEQKIARAVAAYHRKHKTMPDTCAVNAGARGNVRRVGTVRVIGLSNVLRGHYWVGMGEKDDV
jgi:hypothetical protein